jgi:hypothetical protein
MPSRGNASSTGQRVSSRAPACATALIVLALVTVGVLALAGQGEAANPTTGSSGTALGGSAATRSATPAGATITAPSTAAPRTAGGAAAPTSGGTTTYVPSEGATTAPRTRVPTASIPATTSPPAALGALGAGGTRSQAGRPLGTPARTHRAKHGLSTLAIVLAAFGGLLVLACAAWALARERGWEPHWWLSLRHAMAEAGFRASETWAEFADWARLGH